MEKRKKYHDFYLCDIEPEEGSDYMVKQVNSEGKVVFESYMSFEDFDYWNGNNVPKSKLSKYTIMILKAGASVNSKITK